MFLKSVSYNGSEGLAFETLNNLYCDCVLADEPPCSDFVARHEYKCDPTPFLVASCFNRTQVEETRGKKDKGGQGSRRTPTKRQSTTPRKINPKNNTSKGRAMPVKKSGQGTTVASDRKEVKTKGVINVVCETKPGKNLVSTTSVKQFCTTSCKEDRVSGGTRADKKSDQDDKDNKNGDERRKVQTGSNAKKAATHKDK